MKTTRSKWNLSMVEKLLHEAFSKNSEIKLLNLLKCNSFLFYELYDRKDRICPCFSEISFGDYRCDFCWLNDNSSGPEWVLVEIEKPNLKLFKKDGDPTQILSHSVEQVKSWRRFFENHPSEKSRVFGAVAQFKFVLVVGNDNSWNSTKAMQWRLDLLKNNGIVIRSTDVFSRALNVAKTNYERLWSFEEYPSTKKKEDLLSFIENSDYLNNMKRYF